MSAEIRLSTLRSCRTPSVLTIAVIIDPDRGLDLDRFIVGIAERVRDDHASCKRLWRSSMVAHRLTVINDAATCRAHARARATSPTRGSLILGHRNSPLSAQTRIHDAGELCGPSRLILAQRILSILVSNVALCIRRAPAIPCAVATCRARLARRWMLASHGGKSCKPRKRWR